MTADSKGDSSSENATLKSFLSYEIMVRYPKKSFIILLNNEVEKAKEN